MTHQVESTLILKRTYDAPVARVWRAWSDADELARWYVASSDHVVHFAHADVRVGGQYRVGFAPPGETPYIEKGTYLEIVPLQKLVFEESVSLNGAVLFTQVTSVEFIALGERTQLVITGAGVDSWRTGEGWTPAMESLAQHLALPASQVATGRPEHSALVVRRCIQIAAPPARVWQAFASAPAMEQWWGRVTGTPLAGQSHGQWLAAYEPQIGGRAEMEVMMDGERVRYGGRITTFEPMRELTFSNDWMPNRGWLAPTFITLRLTAQLNGTLVELLHHGFEHTGGDAGETHAGYEQGWGMTQLSALKASVEATT